MPTYITLYNWTEQGIKNVKEAPARIEANIKSIKAAGGKVLGVYLTMGKYDLVAISEAPNDETISAALLAQGIKGNVRSTTLKAFTVEQFAEIVKKLALIFMRDPQKGHSSGWPFPSVDGSLQAIPVEMPIRLMVYRGLFPMRAINYLTLRFQI